MKQSMLLAIALLASVMLIRSSDIDPYVSPGVPHPGADQILWVPTLAQAEVVARETGRMILVMGSVGDWKGF
jgi:hypothetical protein